MIKILTYQVRLLGSLIWIRVRQKGLQDIPKNKSLKIVRETSV